MYLNPQLLIKSSSPNRVSVFAKHEKNYFKSSTKFNPVVHLPSVLTVSLLRGAEQMGMHKIVKPQFGGGMRRFSCEEDNIYENIESELCFFTSQVRSQNRWL